MRTITVLIFLFFCNILKIQAQVAGCPDPAANNYNASATLNDGSCTYNAATLSPALKYNLNTTLNESSGLLWWNKQFWTHNDSGGEPAIYAMNATTGAIEKKVSVTNATNVDWEDIAQDKKFIYVGDFGNNANGNRTDLKIYRLAKTDVLAGNTVNATVINFSYNDQVDFTPKGNNNTNFDCEAMIAFNDSLYLFSKDWVDKKTRLYALPKKPGTFSAVKIAEWDVQGLITGAEVVADKRVIVLSGYSTTVSPFIYLLYDFTGSKFFGANKRKITLNESFTQMEGICSKTATAFFISNERSSVLHITTPAKMQQLNLASFLNPYYGTFSLSQHDRRTSKTIKRLNEWAILSIGQTKMQVQKLLNTKESINITVYDLEGKAVIKKVMANSSITIDISSLAKGMYIATLSSGNKEFTQKFTRQ